MIKLMVSPVGKVVPKILAIREEDYWIVAVSIVTVFFMALGLYASVNTFRLPPLILSLIFLWWTSIKIRKGYGRKHQFAHIGATLVASGLVLVGILALTN